MEAMVRTREPLPSSREAFLPGMHGTLCLEVYRVCNSSWNIQCIRKYPRYSPPADGRNSYNKGYLRAFRPSWCRASAFCRAFAARYVVLSAGVCLQIVEVSVLLLLTDRRSLIWFSTSLVNSGSWDLLISALSQLAFKPTSFIPIRPMVEK